jgi:alpha-tubulin suppressor-like RCC1 family protein
MRARVLVVLAVVLAGCSETNDPTALITAPASGAARFLPPLPAEALSCLQRTRDAVLALEASNVLASTESNMLLNRLDVVISHVERNHARPAQNVADAFNFEVQKMADDGRLTADQASSITLAFECLMPVAITAGETHTCVLLSDNSVWCWGGNESGQLGIGTNSSSPIPVRVASLAAKSIDAGGGNTCAVTITGEPWCWGKNEWGQLGNGSTTFANLPTHVSWPVSDAVAQIDAGWAMACARNDAGDTWCWGRNAEGGVGSPNTTERCAFDYCATTPVRISAERTFTDVDAGILGACALDAAGAAYCWGSRGFGAVGDSLLPSFSRCFIDGQRRSRCAAEPTAVAGGYTFKSIEMGAQYVCGIRTDGPTMCWGANDGGMLGLGSLEPFNKYEPTLVTGGLSFTSLAAVDGSSLMAHVCALDASGAAYCWGYNDNGQLGAANSGCAIGGRESPCATTPMAVTGGLTFKAITVGRVHTCGITTDNRVMCWGGNAAGQLGDGTAAPHSAPATVTAMWSDDVALATVRE